MTQFNICPKITLKKCNMLVELCAIQQNSAAQMEMMTGWAC